MGVSFGVIGEMSPRSLIDKCSKIRQLPSFWIFLGILLHPRELAGSQLN